MNLIDMIKDQVSGSLVTNASKFLGESESGVTKALDGVFPALLGKMISGSEDSNQLGKIFDMVKGADAGILDNIGDLFGGGAGNVAQLMNTGSGALSLLLGNNSGSMIDKVAGFSGLKGSATSSLIKMAAPFLMSMIGKYAKDKALDAVGLGKFLGSQKSHVQSAMPAGLLSSLGAGFLGKGFDSVAGIVGGAKDMATGAVGNVTGAAGNVVGAAGDAGKKVVGGAMNAAGDVANVGKAAGGGLMKFLIPIIFILGALGIWKSGILSKATDAAGDVAGSVADVAGDAAGSVADAAGDAAGSVAGAAGDAMDKMGEGFGAVFGKIDEAAKGALDKITFGANSAGKQMIDYIEGGFKGDAKFTFNNLTFATGSSKIDGESGAEVDNLAAILAAYPGVKIHITGHTDNTGSAAGNMQLSQQRANAVKARLMGKNIEGARMTAKGMGSDEPVADNGTKEGRDQNKRVEINIVK